MKRRTFILMTLAAAASISCPIKHNKPNSILVRDPLIWPETLGELTDEKTIREIGLYYQKILPSLYEKEKLHRLLLSDSDGTRVAPHNNIALRDWLRRKTQQDFLTYKTITVNGWVIANTEFRQCALFSFL